MGPVILLQGVSLSRILTHFYESKAAKYVVSETCASVTTERLFRFDYGAYGTVSLSL